MYMGKRRDTKSRMLETAAELVQRQGYASTGLNQILESSGAPKGSLYFHFPGGKEQLVALALEKSSESLSELLEQVLGTAPTPAGCPIATVALEQSATSDALHEVCSRTYARWQSAIAARLVREGQTAERAGELASFILSTIEGALLLCRAHRSIEPLRRASTELARTLKGL